MYETLNSKQIPNIQSDITYDDGIHGFIKEVDSFRFKDTVQVRLPDGARTTALWGQLVKRMPDRLDRFVTCAQVGTVRKCAIMAHMGGRRCNTGNASREPMITVPKWHTFRVRIVAFFFDKTHNFDIFVPGMIIA